VSERRRAIVTGGGSGIGRASALQLAAGGCDVGVTYRANAQGAEDVAAEIRDLGRRAASAELDLARPDTAAAAIDALADALGGLDVLVNNAGVNRRATLLEETIAGFDRTLAVNLVGPWACAQAAARHMIDAGRGGRIVNVTSVHEHIPKAGAAPYCASKGGLGLLTKVMALELAQHGITVNSIAPGEIATPMTGQEDEDPRGNERPGIPAHRPGDAHEIAALVAFVCRDEAAYLTGESIVMDGGLSLMAAQ
jgi:NAD(P)-dependent dehydrogenase (short-subunit alcohol dehydrogenase family)